MSVRNYGDIGENGQKIIQSLLANKNLTKLLYYEDKDPLSQIDLTDNQLNTEVFGKLLKIVPKVVEDGSSKSKVVVKFENFLPNKGNDEFKDILVKIEVITPLDTWIIKNVNLRPFLIMGEIEKTLKGKRVNGLGRMESVGSELLFLTDEVSDYEMTFVITSYD